MKINTKNLVYVGLVLIVFKYTMASSAFQLPGIINTILMILGIICLLPNIVHNKYSIKMICIVCCLLGFSLLIVKQNSDDLILLITLFSISLINVEYEKIIKYYLVVMIVCFIFIVTLSLVTGENMTLTAAYREENVYLTRYTLGFSHPNALHGIYLRIISALVLSKYLATNRKRKYLTLEIVNFILYLFSNSRAGFVVVTVILAMSFWGDLLSKIYKKRIYYILIQILTIGSIGFTIFSTYSYQKYPLLSAVDAIITGRFSHAYRFIVKYPVKLFGTDISEMANIFTLDSGIISTLLSYGIVGITIGSLIYFCGIKRLWEKEKYIEMIVVFGMVLYSMIESLFVNPFVNIGFMLCIYMMVNKKYERNI